MKKFLFISALALFVFNSINAQDYALTDSDQYDLSEMSLTDIEKLTLDRENETAVLQETNDIAFGIIGGLVCSTIYGDEADSFDNRISFHLGIMLTMLMSENFALHGELLYAGMGSDYEDTTGDVELFDTRRGGGGGETFSGTYKLDYLLLLIVAQYYIAEGLSLEAGPQFGILLSAKDEFTFLGETSEEDVKDQTKGFDFGVSGGVGYEFAMGLYLKIRYYLGLLEINDFQFPGNESWKNSGLFASAGWFFN